MGYNKYKHFKGHKDLTDNQITILKKAFQQINENINLLEEYFDIPGHKNSRDGKCLIKRLTGENMLEIRTKDGLSPQARVVPVISLNTNRITFNTNYLNACYNTWKDAVEGDGNKDCAVCELAGTIIHEASHTCLGNEKYAYLVDYYYRWCFRIQKSFTSVTCTAVNQPPSWLPQDYKNKKEVTDAVTWCGTEFEEIPLPPGVTFPPGLPKPGKYYLNCR